MQAATVPLACFLSLIRPPGVQFENSLIQIAPVNKGKCPFVRDNNDIEFQLYTRHNPTVAYSLQIDDDERLFASSIDFNDLTVIYFLAYMETTDDGSGLRVREAFTHRGDTNVITVDAQRLQAGPWYLTAAENTWYIGRIAAQFIDYLVTRGLKLSRTHLVGHSLGAQSAGVAGASLKSGLVSRITGLDPALPLFNKLPLHQRLDPSDAEFVDVIHTDAGIFGVPEQVGHADFFPNGGISPQPGCELEVVVPQQMVLNKCDNTKLTGFYVFHLEDKQLEGHSITIKKERNLLNIARTINTAKNILNFAHDKEKRSDFGMFNAVFSLENEKKILVAKKPKRNIFTIKRLRKQVSPILTKNFNDSETNEESKGKIFLKSKIINAFDNKELRFKKKDLTLDNSRHTEIGTIIPYNIVDNERVSRPIKTLKTLSKIVRGLKTVNNHLKKMKRKSNDIKKMSKSRQKRFVSFFKMPQAFGNENILMKIINFFKKHHTKVLPMISVIREINTIIKTSNGELHNFIKEQNNYVGTNPGSGITNPVTYNLAIGNESRIKAFIASLLGLNQGDKLSISTNT